MITLSLKEAVASQAMLSDRGEPVRWSPLFDAVANIERPEIRRVCLVCPRRSGKSTVAATVALAHVLSQRNAYCLYIGATGESGESIFKQKFGPTFNNNRMAKFGAEVTATEIRFPSLNSMMIVCAPSEANAIGKTITLLVVDEFRMADEELIRLLEPATYGVGKSIYIGTAGKPGTMWHDYFVNPEPTTYSKVFKSVIEAANPCIDITREAEEAKRRADRGPEWMRLLYKRDFESTFTLLDSSSLCNPEDVKRCSRASIQPFDSEVDATIIGCDLSTHHDKTTVVVLARRVDGTMRILELWCWDPQKLGPVEFSTVEKKIIQLVFQYRPNMTVMDRYQGMQLCQNLRSRGILVEDIPVTSVVNQQAFSALSESISSGTITWRTNPELEQEINNLILAENTAGNFRVLDREKRFHRDRSFSLALCIWKACEKRIGVFRREPNYEPRFNNKKSYYFPDSYKESPDDIANRKLRDAELAYETAVQRLHERMM